MMDNSETVSSDRLRMVLGGFTMVRKPLIFFIFNILWLLAIFLLFSYLIAMGILTVYTVPLTTEETVELFQEMCLFTSVPSLPVAAFFGRVSLNVAEKAINSGVFAYRFETDGMSDIKRKYADKIRNVCSTLDNLLLAFTLSKTFVAPVLSYLTAKDVEDDVLNPYLPMKLYAPFSTDSPTGFFVAFLSHALFFMFLHLIVSVHTGVVLSNAFQFIAQLDLLKRSLQDIEERAFDLLRKVKGETAGELYREVFEAEEFQRCMVACLRENIRHHHAIIRLKNVVTPYIESTNGISTACFVVLLAVSSNLLLQESSGRVALIFFLILLSFVYLLTSWVGQMITDKSADLKNCLYFSPWPETGTNYRVLLRIMMANVQSPIVMQVRGFRNEISLKNFSNMTSMAYKVFNVMR